MAQTMWRLVLSALAVLVLSVATPGQSFAKTKKERAKEHVDRGLKYEGQGQYSKALSEYRAAYSILPHHGLRFNMAEACRLLKRNKEALDHYQTFVDLASLADQRKDRQRVATAKKHIQNLEKEIAAQKAEAERIAAQEKERARQLETERLRIEHEKLVAKTRKQQQELERLRLANKVEAERLRKESLRRKQKEQHDRELEQQRIARMQEQERVRQAEAKRRQDEFVRQQAALAAARSAMAPKPAPKPAATVRRSHSLGRRPAYLSPSVRPHVLFGRPANSEFEGVSGFSGGFQVAFDFTGLLSGRSNRDMVRKGIQFGFIMGSADVPQALRDVDPSLDESQFYIVGEFDYRMGLQLGPIGLFGTAGLGFGSYDVDGDIDTDEDETNFFIPVSASAELAVFQYLGLGLRYHKFFRSDLSQSSVYLSGVIPFI